MNLTTTPSVEGGRNADYVRMLMVTGSGTAVRLGA